MLAAVAAAGVAGATGSGAEPACRTLSVVRLGEGAGIFVGSRPAGEADGTSAALAGCGSGDPLLEAYVAVSPRGRPAAARGLPPETVGLPLQLEDGVWILRSSRRGGTTGYQASPLSREQVEAQWIDGATDARVHALARLDDWGFALVEQGRGATLLLRRIGAVGALAELRVDEQVRWETRWPPAVVLRSADGDGADLAAFGWEAGAGRLHVAWPPGSPASAPPPLELPPGASVAPLWFGKGPAAFVRVGELLTFHWLAPTGWRSGPATDLPGPAGAPLAAISPKAGRRTALVVLLEDSRVRLRLWLDGSWAPEVAVALAAAPAAERPALPEALPIEDPTGPSMAPWVLALSAAACLAGLGWLALRWWRGPQERRR